jgi:hypothetical protein
MKPIKSFLKDLPLKIKILIVVVYCSCTFNFIKAVVKITQHSLDPDLKAYYILLACTSFLIMLSIFLQLRKNHRERMAWRMEKMEHLKEIRELLKKRRQLLREIRARLQANKGIN